MQQAASRRSPAVKTTGGRFPAALHATGGWRPCQGALHSRSTSHAISMCEINSGTENELAGGLARLRLVTVGAPCSSLPTPSQFPP